MAVFRMGSGGTISGVPSGFTQIARVDQGSGSTNCTIVAYSYTALGTESGNFATITLSAASKHATLTVAFSGVNTTTPISGTVQTGSGTTSATSGTEQAIPTGDAVIAFIGEQGNAGLPGISTGGMSSAGSGNTTGGSAATNVGIVAAYELGPVASQTYAGSGGGSSTCCIMAFDLAAAASPLAPKPLVVSQAVQRAAIW